MNGATDTRPPSLNKIEYLDGTTKYLLSHGENFRGVYNSVEEFSHIRNVQVAEDFNDLMSDDIKFFFSIGLPFFHLLVNTIPVILFQIENAKKEGKEVSIIFPHISVPNPPVQTLVSTRRIVHEFIERLQSLGVKCIKLPKPHVEGNPLIVRARNIYTIENSALSTYTSLLVRDFYRDTLPENLDPPSKKVFLSRKKTSDSTIVDVQALKEFHKSPYVEYTPTYSRIVNEEKFSDFLYKYAKVETVIPEDFKTFKEQVEFFSNTKLLISATSSGLVNCMFMQPGSLVIELTTPLVTFDRRGGTMFCQSYHNNYSTLAMQYGINYISIPHDRSAQDLIEKIEGAVWLRNLKDL